MHVPRPEQHPTRGIVGSRDQKLPLPPGVERQAQDVGDALLSCSWRAVAASQKATPGLPLIFSHKEATLVLSRLSCCAVPPAHTCSSLTGFWPHLMRIPQVLLLACPG